jgi:hypothetical protein
VRLADADEGERPSLDERVVGGRERNHELGVRPPDERRDPALERADRPVGRRSPLGGDEERAAAADDVDECAKVRGRRDPAPVPGRVEARAVERLRVGDLPQEVGVVAGEHVACQEDLAAVGLGPLAQRVEQLGRQQLVERRVRMLAECLHEAQPRAGAHRMARQEAAQDRAGAQAEERAPEQARHARREAGEEAGDEEVVAHREVDGRVAADEPVRLPVERRHEYRGIRVAAVRGHHEHSRPVDERRSDDADPEARARVDREAEGDEVVETRVPAGHLDLPCRRPAAGDERTHGRVIPVPRLFTRETRRGYS